LGAFLPNLGTLGLWVLELFAMYATDGQTDGQTDRRTDRRTKATLTSHCPLPYGRGIIIITITMFIYYEVDRTQLRQ